MKSQKNDMPRVETPSVFKGIYNITFFTVYSVSLLVGSVSKLDNSGPLVRSGPHFSHYRFPARRFLRPAKRRPRETTCLAAFATCIKANSSERSNVNFRIHAIVKQ